MILRPFHFLATKEDFNPGGVPLGGNEPHLGLSLPWGSQKVELVLSKFLGPDDFNGYGYFYVRLYWTGFGLPANIVEEYILLSVLLHVFVGLKRTWDMKLALVNSQGINVLNLAISGLMLLTFMTIHLFQFRFGDTDQFGPYYVRPPPYLINFWGILSLNLFWTQDTSIEPVGVRDIYAIA